MLFYCSWFSFYFVHSIVWHFKVIWRLFSIVSMFFLFVYKVVSSAKKSVWQWFMKSGKSFINKRNKVGPRIEPWRTPESTW